MQKLVTIYLDNSAYGKGKMLVTSYGDVHGLVEEHLQNHLAEGWTIKSVGGFDMLKLHKVHKEGV